MTELFCAECADAVETEAEDGAVFAADSDVEGVVLQGYGATVGGVADSEKRTDESCVLKSATVLEIEKERCNTAYVFIAGVFALFYFLLETLFTFYFPKVFS